MTEFDREYRELIRRVMTEGYEERNERTGHSVRALPGMTLEVTHGFPLLTLRRIPVRMFVAEQVWFLTGSRRPDESLRQFTKVWDEFTNLDGWHALDEHEVALGEPHGRARIKVVPRDEMVQISRSGQ